MKRIVVVGNGIAGTTAADTLRNEGFDGDLVVVGGESHSPYSRPALSKAALAGGGGPDPDSVYLPESTHGATEYLGVRAASLCVVERELVLADGRTLQFDGLVITTGARPYRFTDSASEFNVRTLDHAFALRKRLSERPAVTVLGGGALGMEVASGARDMGCEVTVVHRGMPMARQSGSFLGELLTSRAKDRGVRFVNDIARDVRQPSSTEATLRVELAEAGAITSPVVITAVGDVPDIAWLDSSGLLDDGRLVTDEFGLAAPGIVAAGDAVWQRSATGLKRKPLWTTAIEQAKVAAQSLLNGPQEIKIQPTYFWTEQFGLSVRTMGDVPLVGEPEVVDGDLSEYHALLRWESGAVAAVNYRIPIPKLRRMAVAQPAPAV
ncbi:NAD(P)/FAD-dependent oxidoreductase [Arthrobacter pigmenti]